MESSRRAVEAYRRTRLVDGVTGDDDKIAPVYKFDEISSVLRSSPHEIVRELTEYIFKRLEHKSPLVKQKTLRLIKFIVGKSGNEFKREIQRQSAAIRQLFHYQGQPDPLRGDSLNKAVRDTARETITAIFSSEEKSPMEQSSRRIEGFGSNNFDSRPFQEKKTLLSEVVDLGAASLKQGLSMISNHYSNLNQYSGNNNSKGFGGSYQAPDLRRTVSDRENFRESYRDSYEEPASFSHESYSEPVSPKSEAGDDHQQSGDDEEKLLDSVTIVGGVRLQPSREALQAFLLAAQKMNPGKLHQGFEAKLQVHSWQVRFKALCFLEAVLRQRSIRVFGEVFQRFGEDHSRIDECTESPQNTLKDKAKKVLSILQGDEGERVVKKKPEYLEMPDLMDTNPGTNGLHELETTPAANSIEDLLGVEDSKPPETIIGDPFTGERALEDPFAGMAIHSSSQASASSGSTTKSNSLLDLASDGGSSSLFEGLSVSEETSGGKQTGVSGGSSILDWQELVTPGSGGDSALKPVSSSGIQLNQGIQGIQQLNQGIQGIQQVNQGIQGIQLNQWQQQQAQMLFMNPGMFPGGVLQPGLFQQQQQQQQFQGMYSGSSSILQQQQQQQFNSGSRVSSGTLDAFDFSSNPYSAASIGIPKMEETTKAFDFISDHVSAARIIKK